MAIPSTDPSESRPAKKNSRFWKRLSYASLALNVLLVLLLLLNSWDGKSAFIQDLDSRLTNLLAG